MKIHVNSNQYKPLRPSRPCSLNWSFISNWWINSFTCSFVEINWSENLNFEPFGGSNIIVC